MKLSRISIAALLAALVVTSGGCALVNRVRAKNALNEGVRAYREGQFAEAEQKFRQAYEFDPTEKNAPLFIARSIQQQYKPGVNTPENIEVGNRAIAAYQDILNKDPANEGAYSTIVYLYGQMKNDDKVTQMLTQRASMTSIPPEKRAEALVILASKQWQCSYDITEQKENKSTEEKGGKVLIHYKKPANQADFDKANQCATQGLQLAEQAVSLDPNSANAWTQKANLLREKSKLAEMSGDAKAKEDLDNQATQARETQAKLAAADQKKKEAEAAASPTPPAS
ncbi:MAG TPA: tetratricopeptide repeat protein [Pyrinomonadaceae bacterium]|nr:tetratricopeptide repeat protein [Pyrinomonadaceae bacterium]